jgi:hypothetical protein
VLFLTVEPLDECGCFEPFTVELEYHDVYNCDASHFVNLVWAAVIPWPECLSGLICSHFLMGCAFNLPGGGNSRLVMTEDCFIACWASPGNFVSCSPLEVYFDTEIGYFSGVLCNGVPIRVRFTVTE